jgi:hypothetical protein
MHRSSGSTLGGVMITGLLLAGLSACGGGTPKASSSSPDAAAVWHDFMRCARTHGMPQLPDPKVDSSGSATFPNGMGDVPASVEQACKSILNQLPPAARGQEAPTDIQGLIRFARCMREHGVPDFPDPRPDGQFPLSGTTLGREGKTPVVRRAMESCKQLNPDPKGGIHGT